MSILHSYGYLKDQPDERDFKFTALHKPEQLPVSVDLRTYCSPVRDQGQLGSCTAFAMATGLREFIQKKNSTKFTVLSPLFLYYEERKLEGTIQQDSGAYIRDGMKVLAKMGVCPEINDKYIISKFRKAPTQAAIKNAKKFKIFVYSRVNTNINDIKSALASGNGVVYGFDVYESFESPEVEQTGNVPMPQPGEQLLGGHAVFACGYVDDPTWAGGGYVITKNSWGSSWGNNGYFQMPYAYFTSQYMGDLWTASN